jgi:hypothetical protein
MISDYRVVYDAAALWFPDWWVPAAGLVFVVLGFLLVRFPDAVRAHRTAVRATGAFIALAAAALVLVTGSQLYRAHSALRQALGTGRFTVVEGTVFDFVPGDAADRRAERWAVNSGGRTYRYEYGVDLSPGYRLSGAHGGLVRDGSRVRIADVDGRIARLELAP